MRYRAKAMIVAMILAASCTSVSRIPDVSSERAATLSANAIQRACEGRCASLDLYVLDRIGTVHGIVGPMPQAVRDAIAEHLPSVAIIDQATAEMLFSEDDDPQVRKSVLITVGPLEKLGAEVVGFSVGLSDSYYNAWGGVHQFRWDGDEWIPATQDDTGIVQPTWVS